MRFSIRAGSDAGSSPLWITQEPALMTAKALLRKAPRTTVRQRPQYSSNSFLSPKCVARRVGDKGGHSVYAGQPIRKGELLVVCSGKLVDEATLYGR